MNKLYLLFIISCCFLFNGYILGQDYLFTVIASSGKSTCQKAAAKEWVNVQTGDKLKKGDKLTINQGDYIGLLHIKGKSLEIKKPGSYDINEIAKNVSSKNPGLLQKFAGFVLSEAVVTKKSGEMKTLGAVVRSRPDLIETGIPLTVSLLEPSMQFLWFPSNPDDKYVFKLINDLNRVVYMTETADTFITLDLNQFNLVRDNRYKWMVNSTKNYKFFSDTSFVYLLSDKNKKSIQDTLSILEEELDKSSAPDGLITAAFLEKNNLTLQALKEYERVVSLASDIEDYKNIYIGFLLRNGLNKKAELLINK